MFNLPPVVYEPLVVQALTEDMGRGGDITAAATIPRGTVARAGIVARHGGVICGLPLAAAAFRLMSAGVSVTPSIADGDRIAAGESLLIVEGDARAILAAERVALNFVGRLSGIATATAAMVAAVSGHKARIAATRKTTPGLRALEKYAVQVGGGVAHRYALDDAILIKDNHIAFAGGVEKALRAARAAAGHTVKIEIEVDTLAQLEEVLRIGGADIVMLDNMTCEDMARAVNMVDGRCLVEASGGVTLESLPAIAATGVDLISVGALTHSVINFDVGLDVV